MMECSPAEQHSEHGGDTAFSLDTLFIRAYEAFGTDPTHSLQYAEDAYQRIKLTGGLSAESREIMLLHAALLGYCALQHSELVQDKEIRTLWDSRYFGRHAAVEFQDIGLAKTLPLGPLRSYAERTVTATSVPSTSRRRFGFRRGRHNDQQPPLGA